MITAVLIVALISAPACLLVGVGAGAFLTHRLMKGLSPLPLPQRKIEVVPAKPANPPMRLPKVGA